MTIRRLTAAAIVHLMVLLAIVCAASAAQGKTRYRSQAYAFSIIFPEGWEFFEKESEEALVTVGARKDDEGAMVVTVARQSPQLSTFDEFLICQQIEEIVTRQLGGYNVRCSQTRAGGKPAQNALYMRKVKRGEEDVHQFVSQIVINYRSLVYTITSYAFGPTEAEAMASYARLAPRIQLSITSFALH